MNIYEQHAMHYEKLLKEQKFDEMNKDEIECKVKVSRLAAGLSKKEQNALIDTSIFNSTIRAYLIAAMKIADLGNEQEARVLDALNEIFDSYTADEIQNFGK